MTLTRFAVVVSLVCAIALAALARPFGVEPVRALLFAVFALLVAATAPPLVRLFPWRGTADAIARSAVIAIGTIVVSMMLLGLAHLLHPAAAVAWFAVLAGAAMWLSRRAPAGPSLLLSLPVPIVAAAAGLLALIVAFGLLHSPLTAYDSLSYHLLFPARWLQDGHLSIIPTPFSDEAQAYAPANGELFYLWLMLPLHSDLLARIGQIPFLLVLMMLVYLLGRRAGAPASHAIWPAVFCLVSRPLVEQATGADVDLVCWSFFLASVYFGLLAIETNERRDWILWGAALGLYAGTKYVALVYAPIFLLLLLPWLLDRTRRQISRVLWLLPGLAMFAAPWYARNWFIAGSPLYPASLSVAGLTIARGAYSRAAMLHSVFHTTDPRLFAPMLAHAIGATLLIVWVPLFALGLVKLLWTTRTWPARFIAMAPFFMALLYWFGVPDNVDSRFMLPVAVLALIPLAFVFRGTAGDRPSVWNIAVHSLFAAVMVWPLIGANTEIPAKLPWFMGGWLSLRGLVAAERLPLLAGAVAIAMAALRFSPPRLRPAAAMTVSAALATVLAIQPQFACGTPECNYLEATSIFLRPTFVDASRWIEQHVTGATFASVGNNVPYLVVGPQLQNRVVYVNTDRHPSWRFHDYDRAARQRVAVSGREALATSSGVLLPIDSPAGRVDAVRPRYERMRGDPDAWIENLRLAGADHVFISALSAYEIDYVWHDAGGFPIEETWARANPARFQLIYENPQVRIYAVAAGRY